MKSAVYSGNSATARDEPYENWCVEIDGPHTEDDGSPKKKSRASKRKSRTRSAAAGPKKKQVKRTKTPAPKAATKNQNPKPAAAAAATAAAVDSDSDSKVSTAAAKTKKLPRGILERARAGDMQPLLDHFKETDLYSFAGTSLTNQEWAGLMPPWSGQKADRGLKHWKSETARGGFDFACLCEDIANICLCVVRVV